MKYIFAAAIMVMAAVLTYKLFVDPGWLYHANGDWQYGFETGVVCMILARGVASIFEGFFGELYRDIRQHRGKSR